jgi:hypothetical protein
MAVTESWLLVLELRLGMQDVDLVSIQSGEVWVGNFCLERASTWGHVLKDEVWRKLSGSIS